MKQLLSGLFMPQKYIYTTYTNKLVIIVHIDKDEKYGDFYRLLHTLTEIGIYSPILLEKYSKDEIDKLAQMIDPKLDLLFDYIGLHTLATRYLATDHEKNVYELPQERWLIVAMHLMQDEPTEKRLDLLLKVIGHYHIYT